MSIDAMVHDIEREREARRQAAAPPDLSNGKDGGTSDGMDPWQTAVEARLTDLRNDVRDLGGKIDGNTKWVVSAFAAGFVLLCGAMAGGFLWIADKLP